MSQPWKLIVDKIADTQRVRIIREDATIVLQVLLGSDELGPEIQYVCEELIAEGAKRMAAIAAAHRECWATNQGN